MSISDCQTLRHQANKNPFITLLLEILIIGIVIAYCTGKYDILPVFFVSLISAGVVYGNAQDSKNKLRLELFQARYEIYEDLIKFCSHVLQQGDIKEDGWKAAENSFRGLKYHKSSFLFGEEIEKYFREINHSFAHVVSFNNNSPEWLEHTTKILNINSDAPIKFKPYLYFGDIKVV